MESSPELERKLNEQLMDSLSLYKAEYLSYFHNCQLQLPEKAKEEVNMIQNLFVLDLKALSDKYTRALVEFRALIPSGAIQTVQVGQQHSSSDARRLVLQSTRAEVLRTFLMKAEVRKKAFNIMDGKPMHELSLGDAAASNNGALLQAQIQTNPGKIKEQAKFDRYLNTHRSPTISCCDVDYPTPLMRAVQSNALQAARILLSAGADPNAAKYMLGLGHSDREVISKKKKPVVLSALSIAYSNDNWDMIELLLSHGAKPEHRLLGEDCLVKKAIIEGGDMTRRSFRLLVNSCAAFTPHDDFSSFPVEWYEVLNCALQKGDLGISAQLLSTLPPVDTSQIHESSYNREKWEHLKKCLQTTIKSKNHFLTKLLLERGDPIIDQATVNNALASGDEHILSLLLSGLGCSTPDFAQQNFPPVNSWRTMFRPAIVDQHIGGLRALLKIKHCFPLLMKEREERNLGQTVCFEGTPLMLAVGNEKLGSLHVLLTSELYQSQQDVDERPGPLTQAGVFLPASPNPLKLWRKGDTALFLAAARGNSRAIAALLRARANPYITNEEGDKAIHRLIRALREEVLATFAPTERRQAISGEVGQCFAEGLSAMLKYCPNLVDVTDASQRTALMLLVTPIQATATRNWPRMNHAKVDVHHAAALQPVAEALLLNGADFSAVEQCIQSEAVDHAYKQAVKQVGVLQQKKKKRIEEGGAQPKKKKRQRRGEKASIFQAFCFDEIDSSSSSDDETSGIAMNWGY